MSVQSAVVPTFSAGASAELKLAVRSVAMQRGLDSPSGRHNVSAYIHKCRGIVTQGTPNGRVRRLFERAGIVRSRDLELAGMTRTQLRRLVERDVIERVGRGLYTLPGAYGTEQSDLAHAAKLVPGGVVCLLSALRFHGLTTQNPFEVWLAIDRKAWRPRIEHPPLRLIFMSGMAMTEGVEQHDVGGVKIQLFSAAKTVADCFKFRNRIGTDVAVEALREYRRRFPKRLEDVVRYAKVDRVARVIQPYLESVA